MEVIFAGTGQYLDYSTYEYELVQIISQGGDSSVSSSWNSASYWYDYGDYGCTSGETIANLSGSCDTTDAYYS